MHCTELCSNDRTVLGDIGQCEYECLLQVCGGPALALFQYQELDLLVAGLPHLDFTALQKTTKYEGGYSANHSLVQQFWEVLLSLPFEAKRKFLMFVTGCDRYV